MHHTEEQRQRIEANRQEAARRLALTRERQNQAQLAQRNAAPVNQNGSRSLDSFPGGPAGSRNGMNHNMVSSGIVQNPNPFSNMSVRTPAALVRPSFLPNHHAPCNPFALRAPSLPIRNTAPVLPVPPKPPATRIPAKASLLPRGRFQVTSAYSAQLAELCKRFKSKSYNPKDRTWSFHLSDYTSFDKAVQGELKACVAWEGLPKFIQEAFVKGKFADKSNSVDLSEKIPPTLLNSLLPYQVEGVRFAVRNGGRVLIADDMGLGKTIQAIATASYFQQFPVLCVAPSSMRFEWKEQWLRWCPQFKDYDVQVLTSGRQVDPSTSAKIVIVTYDLLSSIQKQLVKTGFPTIICDESHSLKTYKAKRTEAAMEICKLAKHIILLSGTPALSRPQELYSQIEIIDKTLFKNFPEFGRRYCDGHMSNRGFMDYNGKSNTEELQVVLESTVMIRRLKKDVANQLPEKSRKVVLLDSDIVQFNTKELADSQENFRRQTVSKTASHHEKRGSLLNYYQQTGKAKVPAVIQYLQQLFEGNETLKVVIFAHHSYVLNEIYDALSETLRGIRIDGSTATEDRKVLCDTFQQDDNCRIAVLSITACSTGITLTAASVVVFAELYWNPGILAQAEDRLHRLGQRNNVTVLYLIAKDTADDPMWEMLKRKLEFLNDVGLSKDNYNNVNTENQETLLPSGLSWEVFLGDEANWDACDASTDGPSTKRMKTEENV